MSPTSRAEAGAAGRDWESTARERLHAAGYRSGGAREAVVSRLSGEACALSASELADGLRDEGRRVSQASIYRALEVLSELGLVHRTDLAEGPSRFEVARSDGRHHHHAICERCGEMTPFEDEELEAALARIADRLPHDVSSHDVVLRGSCPGCERR